MRIAVIIGTVALVATAFTTTAYASAAFGNLGKDFSKTPHRETSRHNKGAGMNLKFPDFELKMKPSKSRNKKNGVQSRHGVPENHSNKPTPPQTPQTPQKPSVGDNGNDPGNNGGNNTNPPQLNSHDIKGFDPFSGLYGPGT